jgi:hypothetical protein
MRTSVRLSVTALVAALLLASAIGTASAGRLSINEQFIRTTWSNFEFANSLVTVRCPITLEGSFHSRTIPKSVALLLIGAVTKIQIKNESCTNAQVGASMLPWHITYEGFTGTLPSITAIFPLLQRVLWELIRPLGLVRTCRYGTATDRMLYSAGINAERLVTTLTPARNTHILSILEGPLGGLTGCPTITGFSNSAADGTSRILNTNGFIKITLI